MVVRLFKDKSLLQRTRNRADNKTSIFLWKKDENKNIYKKVSQLEEDIPAH